MKMNAGTEQKGGDTRPAFDRIRHNSRETHVPSQYDALIGMLVEGVTSFNAEVEAASALLVKKDEAKAGLNATAYLFPTDHVGPVYKDDGSLSDLSYSIRHLASLKSEVATLQAAVDFAVGKVVKAMTATPASTPEAVAALKDKRDELEALRLTLTKTAKLNPKQLLTVEAIPQLASVKAPSATRPASGQKGVRKSQVTFLINGEAKAYPSLSAVSWHVFKVPGRDPEQMSADEVKAWLSENGVTEPMSNWGPFPLPNRTDGRTIECRIVEATAEPVAS